MPNYNFWDIEWGPDESKGDRNLQRYFVPIPEYNDIFKGEYRYIIGRKGCGKTAILEKVKYEVENNALGFSKSLTLRNFPLPLLRQLRDKSMSDKSQFVPIWKFLIIVEVCKMIAKDNGICDNSIKEEITEFLVKNFPGDCAFVDTLTFLSKNQAKVSLLSKWIGVEDSFERGREATTYIHYQKAYDILLDKVSNIRTESSYYIFFDELDEGYKARDTSIRLLLLALLRAIEDMFLEFEDLNINFRPLLALRSDIFDGLEDNDLNKLDDYLIRLNWSAQTSTQYSLKDIVNARICASLNLDKGIDAWDLIVEDNYDRDNSKRSLWDYMCNQTFEKPRDIIKYLKYCKKTKGESEKLTYNVVQQAGYKYSGWFYSELRDEIHSVLEVWKESLKSITQLGYGRFSAEEITEIFKKDSSIRNWKEETNANYEDILECLFDYGVIGNLDVNDRWLFKYKDYDLDWSASKDIIVHFGFYKKLKLRPRNKGTGYRK